MTVTRTRRLRVLGSAIMIIGAALVPSGVGASEQTGNATEPSVWFNAEPDCTGVPFRHLEVGEIKEDESDIADPLTVPEAHRWIDNERAQLAVDRIAGVLGTHSDIVIGSFIDRISRELVVVVDPNTAFKDLIDEIATEVGRDINVRIEQACVSKDHIDEILERISSGAWYDGGGESFHYIVMVDPITGQVKLHVPSGRPDVSAAARSAFDQREVEVVSEIQLHDRMNDGVPHYGGAAIGPPSGQGLTPACTAGPMVDKNGGRWGTTAAHCDGANPSVNWYTN